MCGITGFYTPSGFPSAEGKTMLFNMRERLMHRGPDDAGTWLDSEVGIALGHRRLAIVDLSFSGHQPMTSISGRFVLAFNGEIYNHGDIRDRLTSSSSFWRGQSDTETLLAAIDCWGLERALQATVGMFALALWDRHDQKIYLARDRMGEKPLYYGWQNGVLLFGSELKSLCAHPAFERKIEPSTIPLYLRHGYIPNPWSIYKGIRKLLPGTWISFLDQNRNQMPEPTPYWSLTEEVLKGQSDPFKGTEDDAIDELERLLGQSIAGQRVADVPLGAFLSGGIDSSAVVALMQAQSSKSVKTFTIGFKETGYNEAEYARAVAKHLDTDHTEIYVSPDQARQVIPQLPKVYDEPFGDSSGIPTYLVARLARAHVTVCLSGDGGDELFGGYKRYSGFQRWHKRAASIPIAFKSMAAAGVRRFPKVGSSSIQRRSELLSGVLDAKHPAVLYQTLIRHWLPTDGVALNTEEASYWMTQGASSMALNEPLDHALLADMKTYLPDDILVKVDRATMANSLEARVPMLDHRLVEWSWSLPQRMKSRGGHQKWVLRAMLCRHLPEALIERPKMGFGVPIGSWLRGPLKDWAEELLDPHLMQQDGWLNTYSVQKKWSEHLTGANQWEHLLWDVLMFQAWLREQIQ